MKKIIQSSIAFICLIVIAQGCTVVNKTAGDARSRFVGNWTIVGVTYEGVIGGAVTKVFDQATPSEFVGSTWVLTNSGNAVYRLTNGTSQSIYWSYYNPGGGVEPMFQFKRVYAGDAPKNVADGYRLVIANITDNSMTLKSPVDLGGSTGYVVYAFTKGK